MISSKHYLTSKTFWANIIALGVSVGTAFGLDLNIDAEAQTAVVGGIMAIVNIILRFMTKAPVTVT